MGSERLVGDRRCWPCTVANLAVGVLVAWTPLAMLASVGNDSAVPVAAGWGLAVTVFTLYRLLARGYLPLAETVGRSTGLHERVGPDRGPTRSTRRERSEQSCDDGEGPR